MTSDQEEVVGLKKNYLVVVETKKVSIEKGMYTVEATDEREAGALVEAGQGKPISHVRTNHDTAPRIYSITQISDLGKIAQSEPEDSLGEQVVINGS